MQPISDQTLQPDTPAYHAQLALNRLEFVLSRIPTTERRLNIWARNIAKDLVSL